MTNKKEKLGPYASQLKIADCKAQIHKLRIKLKRIEPFERKYGNELADLDKIRTALTQSLESLPEGNLRLAAQERRDEIELRMKNLKRRYPKGCDQPISFYENEILKFEEQIRDAEKALKIFK